MLSAYVANYQDNSVSQYTIDPGGGQLVMGWDPASTGLNLSPDDMAISPDGKSAYVTNYTSKTISQYHVDVSDGALKAMAPSAVVTDAHLQAIAISPDGKSAYVPDYNNNTISQFTISANGTLITKADPMPTAEFPKAITISPAQSPTATLTAQGGVAKANDPAQASAASFDASAAKNASSYAWDFGDGQSETVSTPTTTHQYQSAGTYAATLTTSNSECDSDAVFTGSIVFTGQTAYCNGPMTSTQTEQLEVASPTSPPPTTFPSASPSISPSPSTSPTSSSSKITFRSRTSTLDRKGFLTFKLTCKGANTCSGTLTLKTAGKVTTRSRTKRKKRRVKLGAKRFSIPAGKTRKVRVKISKSRRRYVKKKVAATAKLTLSSKEAKAATKTVTKTIKVKKARRCKQKRCR